MAGFYPDVPDNRIAFDTNGSIFYRADTVGNVTELANTEAVKVNNELSDFYLQSTDGYVGVLFPIAFDVAGVYISAGDSAETWGSLQASVDTTNGYDGTWISQAISKETSTAKNRMRQNIVLTPTFSGVKAVRLLRTNLIFDGRRAFKTFHIYGIPTATSNRLDFWDPTLDQAIAPAHFDWGDTARGSTDTLTYRIKNQSASLTANSIDISTEILTDGTPSLLPMFEHSTDGTNFSSTINIGSLAPGAISGTLHVRKTLAANAPLSLWWPRFKAAPGSWT